MSSLFETRNTIIKPDFICKNTITSSNSTVTINDDLTLEQIKH